MVQRIRSQSATRPNTQRRCIEVRFGAALKEPDVPRLNTQATLRALETAGGLSAPRLSLLCYLARYSAVLKQESKKGRVMTYEMWGIAIGMALMFGFSLKRYLQNAVHESQSDRSTKQRLLRKLRERYGL